MSVRGGKKCRYVRGVVRYFTILVVCIRSGGNGSSGHLDK